jgi:hypothetical protein
MFGPAVLSFLYDSALNCSINRTSFSKNKRMSLTLYFNMAIRSIPIPKAKPVYLSGSILQLLKTAGSTIPQPIISTQPVYLQMLQPSPPQSEQEMSISAEGSVKGKYDGLSLMRVSCPNISLAKYNNVWRKSANDTFSSIYNPSTFRGKWPGWAAFVVP